MCFPPSVLHACQLPWTLSIGISCPLEIVGWFVSLFIQFHPTYIWMSPLLPRCKTVATHVRRVDISDRPIIINTNVSLVAPNSHWQLQDRARSGWISLNEWIRKSMPFRYSHTNDRPSLYVYQRKVGCSRGRPCIPGGRFGGRLFWVKQW